MPSRSSRKHHNLDKKENLPMEENLLLEDGYYRKAEKVLPFGNKVRHSSGQYMEAPNKKPSGYDLEYAAQFQEDDLDENFDDSNELNYLDGDNLNYPRKWEKNNFGAGGSKVQPSSLNQLRKKNAFNWQKVSRNLAIFGIFLTILAILTTGTGFAWYTYQYNNAPNISDRFNNFEESSVIFANDGKTRIFELFGRKAGDGRRENVSIERIPRSMQLATVAIEDRFFYYNDDGIPWQNIAGALVDCVLGGFKGCRGGSGLSQQLVKNVTGDDNLSTDRKIRELFTAIKMNREGGADGKEISKDDVLTAYLNISFFSRNSLGVQQASRAYFGHDVDAKGENGEYLLTPPKACYLASLVQSPTTYSNAIEERDSEAWAVYEKRKNDCLEIMAGKKYTNDKGQPFNIQGDGQEMFVKTDEELEKWKAEKVEFVANRIEDPYPHFRGYVQQEIVKYLESIGLLETALYNRGLKIVTTLDPTIQKRTEEIVKNNGDKIRSVGGNNAAAMVLDGPSGGILAMVGSLDYNNEEIKGKVNIATTPQQPGSSIKPYVYASAFNQGFNPGTILIDAPTTFDGGFKPNNFARDFKGPMSIHYSLSNSRNIPAVKALFLSSGTQKLDGRSALDNWFDFTENSGVRFPCQNGDKDDADASKNCGNTPETGKDALYRNRCFYGSAIGGCEVTMTSHITGVNTLLQEGNLSTTTPFKSITDKNGVDLFTPENRNLIYPKVDKKIEPTVARQIAQVMADQNRVEFGQFQNLFTIKNWKLAGKTGTTDGNRDTWMVGGSPLFTTTVWAGRTDNGEMAANVQASNLALPMWNEIQQMLHTDRKVQNFSTEGLKQVALDPQTGFLIGGDGVLEWLNDKQIRALQEAGGRISRPEYDPRTQNIFQNRSSVVTKNVKFNKLDGKLAVEGKTLPENIEEKLCTEMIGEFPDAKGWTETLAAPKEQTLYVKKDPETGKDVELYRSGCGLVEKSDQDQIADKGKTPEIKNDNNIQNGSTNVGEIKATFKSPVSSKKITKAYIKVNGQTVKNYQNKDGTPEITLSVLAEDVAKNLDLIQGDKVTISLETEDSTGTTSNQTISNVILAGGKSGTPRDFENPNSQNISQPNSQSSGKITGTIQQPTNLSVREGSAILSVEVSQTLPKAPVLTITQGNKSTSCQSFSLSQNYVCGVSLADFSSGPAKVTVSEDNYGIADLNITFKP